MSTSTYLQDLAKPVDMTGWPPDPSDIPQPIAPIRPLSPLSPSTPTAGDSAASGRFGALGIDPTTGNANVAAVPSLTGPGTVVSSITTWITAHLEDFVFIIIGLILIGAAVFSFKPVQDAVVSTAKTAAEVAA